MNEIEKILRYYQGNNLIVGKTTLDSLKNDLIRWRNKSGYKLAVNHLPLPGDMWKDTYEYCKQAEQNFDKAFKEGV